MCIIVCRPLPITAKLAHYYFVNVSVENCDWVDVDKSDVSVVNPQIDPPLDSIVDGKYVFLYSA